MRLNLSVSTARLRGRRASPATPATSRCAPAARRPATAALALLLAVAAGCVLLGRPSAAATAGAAVAMLALALGYGALGSALLNPLQRPHLRPETLAWGARNAIVLPAAGIDCSAGRPQPGLFGHARIVEAARAYRSCRAHGAACRIYVSGGRTGSRGEAPAVLYARILRALGVAASDLAAECDSVNTWQSAERVAELLSLWQPDRVVVVSSAWHLSRALLYLRHFGVDAAARAADDARLRTSLLPSAFNVLMADRALHECIGIARYRALRAVGRSPSPRRPGQA